MKFGKVVQMSFKEKVYTRTDDGRRAIIIPHLEPSAQVSLKLRFNVLVGLQCEQPWLKGQP